MAAIKLRDGLHWVGAQDPDLRVFDVVMRTEHGTSYNAFLLQAGGRRVLFETAKAKFFDAFLANLSEVCPPGSLDYIVISHTEPDHAGSLERLLPLAPRATVLASQTALGFLQDICNRGIPGRAVADGMRLDLGGGVALRFLSVPFLHWPDSIYTYIEGMGVLVTCDSFGCHYAAPRITNDTVAGNFEPAYRYYFNMIMGPFKRHVRHALSRIKPLDISMICTGHGPVLKKGLDYYIGLYEAWSAEPEPPPRDRPSAVIAFVSAYGYTESVAQALADELRSGAGAEVLLRDMVSADPKAVAAELASADAILLGSPTVNGDALPPVMDLAMGLNGILHGGKVAAAFGSYGWSGEAADMLNARLAAVRMKTVEPPLKIKFKPGQADMQAVRAFGARVARKLKAEWEARAARGSGESRSFWKCVVCGEVFEGGLPPSVCPVCGAGQEAFAEHRPERVSFRSETPVRLVVAGAGAAGVAAAMAARQRNPNAAITVFSAEPETPYYRPLLTKSLGDGALPDGFLQHPAARYAEMGIDLRLGAAVASIDRRAKLVRLSDGSAAPYDKLVLATGARAFVPPIPGAELPEVVALRELPDFRKLKRLLAGGARRVVVLGGGLLGLETACGLARLGHDVTVVEACPGILPRQLDAGGSRLLARLIAQAKAKVVTGVFAEEILGSSSVSGVKTKDGRVRECDIVVVSIGVRPNVELAKAAGLAVDRAIAVDASMRTSDPDIFAAGDCAIFGGRCDGVWETALEQGKVAGAAAMGESAVYTPRLVAATLSAFHTKIVSIGDLGRDESASYLTACAVDEPAGLYKACYFKDGRLAGGLLIGDVSKTNALLVGVAAGLSPEDAREAKLI